MKITEATIIKDNFGPDLVLLTTSLPCAMGSNKNGVIKIDAAKDKGQDYVKTHFPEAKVRIIPA